MSKRTRTSQHLAVAGTMTGVDTSRKRRHPSRADRRAERRRHRTDPRLKAALVIGIGVLLLGALFYASNIRNAPANAGDQYPYEIASPAAGEVAPAMALPGTDGATFDLSTHRGETVLLYFQEGLMCRPCWDQIVEMEKNWNRYEALGIDRLVSITSDPLDLLEQKVKDEDISTPLLSDPELKVSRTYQANLYGMMGTSMNGHTFVLVNVEGTILWRADYGGPPKYTMFVPTDVLIEEMQPVLKSGDSVSA